MKVEFNGQEHEVDDDLYKHLTNKTEANRQGQQAAMERASQQLVKNFSTELAEFTDKQGTQYKDVLAALSEKVNGLKQEIPAESNDAKIERLQAEMQAKFDTQVREHNEQTATNLMLERVKSKAMAMGLDETMESIFIDAVKQHFTAELDDKGDGKFRELASDTFFYVDDQPATPKDIVDAMFTKVPKFKDQKKAGSFGQSFGGKGTHQSVSDLQKMGSEARMARNIQAGNIN